MASSLSSLPRNWDHDVFPSFHGQDVRQNFLSHMLKEFRSKGINMFIDNNIDRGESIGPELIRAIRGSKIGIVLLSQRYASSSWCLDELVEIMNRESGQMVITIFYKVNPTDVKKQRGDFGEVFEETCQGKNREKIQTWRQALESVATIAGYHITNMDNEAAMIEEIAVHISNKLNIATPSGDFDRFIGMEAHMERLQPLLRLDLDEVRMIGIWGPPGIGKSTIARVLFNHVSRRSFQLRAIMVNIKGNYPRPCLDEGSAQLQLQNQMLSQMLNHKDLVITHLGVAQQRLKDKKVFLVLDDVDKISQLVALAGKIHWFGPGSRIVITTENQRILKAHGIKDIYKVDFPTTDEALEMFCIYAFEQKYPKYGFMTLSREITWLVGRLPLGLKVMGSYFRGMSKDEWTKTLPMLRSRLNGDIESVLKFSYDALDDEDKDLFLHIACFFNHVDIEEVTDYLGKRFPHCRQQLDVLSEKALISMEGGRIVMHGLLMQLGRDIDRKRCGQRQFLNHNKEMIDDDASGRRSVIGICIETWPKVKLNINERAFEGMTNLQFIRIQGCLSHGMSYLSPKIRLLDWECFPMTCLPSSINLEFLVKLNMVRSKLEKLWEGTKLLQNLKEMRLSCSKNLKGLPNLSTAISLKELHLDGCSNLLKLPSSIGSATNLKDLNLSDCSSLVELPSSIGSATNLKKLKLSGCSSLVELPSSIGSATNLQDLNLTGCSSLVELPSSIGSATNLQDLNLTGCSSLVELPSSIGNATNLQKLNLNGCSSLVELPSSIGNATNLEELNLTGCSSLVELPSSIDKATNLQRVVLKNCLSLMEIGNLKSLDSLDLSGCSSLKVFPEIPTNIWYLFLSGTAIEEVPSSIMRCYRLVQLILKGCRKIVSLPQLPESLSDLNMESCESLERLDCSFSKSYKKLNFANCFKLNKDARDLIIQSSSWYTRILPGKEIPICFTYRANGGSLRLEFNERNFPYFLTIEACILLGCKNDTVIERCPYILEEIEENDVGYSDDGEYELVHRKVSIYLRIRDKHNGVVMHTHKITKLCRPLTEHLYISEHLFSFEEDVTSHELFFEFSVCGDDKWVIKECGMNYEGCGMNNEDCEAQEETNEADVTSPGNEIFYEFLTNEAGEETNEGDCAERKKRKMDQDVDTSLVIGTSSKYTSNSGAGGSKSMVIEMGLDGEKVFKAIHEHANAFLPSEVGINGDRKAEEDLNGNDSAETKKRKRQSLFTFVDMNSTSEVANNGDCEADEEVNGNDIAKTKKSRLSL